MKKKRLLVFSADSMVTEDLALLETLPNFTRLLKGGVRAEHVQGIYPSLTYPAHASILTGCWPDKTGVVNNLIYTEDTLCGDWEWDAAALRAEDLFTAAKRAGYTTASVLWPVTGGHPAVDYLINEAWRLRPGEGVGRLFARYGSKPEVIGILLRNLKYLAPGYMDKGLAIHPEYDDFGVACACDIIRRYKPELLLVHSCPVDTSRHEYGVFSDKLPEAIKRVDRHLGQLADALEEAGVLEETNLALISDHGQLDYARTAQVNAALIDAGFLSLREDGVLDESWRAYARAAGMSAYVYIHHPEDRETVEQVHSFLKTLEGISRVYTQEEARKEERLGGDFSFVLETDGQTAFSNGCQGPYLRCAETKAPGYGQGQHGYLPRKGPQPVFVARGPDFAENAVLPPFHLVDEAPSFARLLGFELPEADGRWAPGLLREGGSGL